MPVIWVRPVTVEEYSTAMREGAWYQCPVYTNMQRANVYSPIVSVFTLRIKEAADDVAKQENAKWTTASVALLLQDELA